MTRNRRAAIGRTAPAFAIVGLLALAACEKGPDKAETAADLKSGVEAQLKRLEGASARKVLTHSAVTVTPQDDAFLVSIGGLKIQPEAAGYLEIGTISYVATPKDDNAYQISDLKLPQTMPFRGLDGKDRGKLTITTKSFSGLWSRELGTFRTIDAEFADLAASDDRGGDVRLSNARFDASLADKGGGVFDSLGSLILSGFTATETNRGTFAISETRLDGKYDSLKLAEYQAALGKYQELAVKQVALAEPAASGQPASLSSEDQKAMADAIAAMAASVKGGDFKIAFNDMRYSEAGSEPFRLGALTLGTRIDGVNQQKATLGFDIAHRDLALAVDGMSSPVDRAALPKSGNLSLKITDIPSKDIAKVLADNLPGVASADLAMAKANAAAMLVALQAVFQASAAKIEVAPSQLVSELVELKADGLFDLAPQSTFGLVGALNVALRGMDDLVALARQTPQDDQAQQAIGAADMLRQYSAREQGADGRPVDRFRIELNEAGQILINGKPL